MKQTILALILCLLMTNIRGNHPSYSFSYWNFGVRNLSVQSVNDALKIEGLAELKPVAFAANGLIGFAFWEENFVFNGKLSVFRSENKEGINLTWFGGFGSSFDFGYQIWKNDKMCLYPFINLTIMATFFKTQQKTDAKSFSAVYHQPLIERSFNSGELDSALGLAYSVRIGKRDILEIRGGYNFPLLRGKWRYIDEKIDFPKIDCRGWEIGVTWATNIKSKKQKD